MRNIWIIAQREYRHYFISPLAYIVALLILLVMGIYFLLVLFQNASMAFYGGATPPSTQDILGILPFMLLFAAPALTMRLLADEHRTGTLELLLTAPIRDVELIVGKWLGAFLFMLTLIAITLIFPIILHFWLVDNGIDQLLMLSNYLGIILVSGVFLAIGTAISAIFKNQFAALFATLVALFFLWYLIGWPAYVMVGGGEVFRYLGLSDHYYNGFATGAVDLGDIVYYISWIVISLFIGTTAIEMRRWQ
ncbi:MAG: ABC transporter permease [Anaerolineales bacterium]|nr:ABC transporter permease [Anaerolineales bacterium]